MKTTPFFVNTTFEYFYDVLNRYPGARSFAMENGRIILSNHFATSYLRPHYITLDGRYVYIDGDVEIVERLGPIIAFDVTVLGDNNIRIVAGCEQPATRDFLTRLLEEIETCWPGTFPFPTPTPEGDGGGGGRRSLTDDEWKKRHERVEAVLEKAKGLLISEEKACGRLGVPYGTFKNWKRHWMNKG